MIRVADYVAEFIYNSGVKHIFLVTGGGAMHLNDGIAAHKKIKYVCCHHEQTVSMAIESYSRITENLGVGCVTSGPGGTNTVTGIVSAWQDSIPCMIISGQSKRKETIAHSKLDGLRQFGSLEVNIVDIVKSITKYSVMVMDPKMIRYHLEKAVYLAKSGRPGPVWIDVPLDVQGAMVDQNTLKKFTPPEKKQPDISKSLKELIKLLKNAKKPVVIAGSGIRSAKAIPQFLSFIEKTNIPTVNTFMSLDIIENDHSLYIGRLGTKGNRAANFAVQNADLLIAIGTSLKVTVIGYEYDLFAPKAKKVAIDIDPIEHKKPTIKIDLFIESDAKYFLEELYKECKDENITSPDLWKTVCSNWKNKYPPVLVSQESDEIDMYYFVDRLSNHTKKEDIIICDAGYPFYVVAQALRLKEGQRYITPGSLGTMGYNLPAAIGASTADKSKRVICITGDGSLQMNIQELQTIVHNSIPVKIFVLNNCGYVSIKEAQLRYFGRVIGAGKDTGISFPELSKIANAYGIKYITVSNPSELDTVIKSTLGYDEPVICDIKTTQNQKISPIVTSEIRPDGSMVSKPLDDMYPFLDRKTYFNETNV